MAPPKTKRHLGLHLTEVPSPPITVKLPNGWETVGVAPVYVKKGQDFFNITISSGGIIASSVMTWHAETPSTTPYWLVRRTVGNTVSLGCLRTITPEIIYPQGVPYIPEDFWATGHFVLANVPVADKYVLMPHGQVEELTPEFCSVQLPLVLMALSKRIS